MVSEHLVDEAVLGSSFNHSLHISHAMDSPQDLFAPPGFLKLPPAIRARIFRLSGIVRACPIGLAYERQRLKDLTPPDSRGVRQCFSPWPIAENFHYYRPGHCRHDPLPIALLRVNRLVYDEVLPILYGENNFYFSKDEFKCPGGYDAQRLYDLLFPRVCLHLKELYIGLESNEKSCSVDHVREFFHSFAKYIECLAAKLHPWTTQLVVYLYGNLGKTIHIFPSLRLFKLRSLRIFFKVDSSRTDLGSLLAILPTGFSFERSMGGDIDILTSPQLATFPYEKLPAELRRNVLYHTGLVQPQDHLKFSVSTHWKTISPEDRRCCRKCRPAFEEKCACKWKRIYSSTCTCLAVPKALFRVSRRMRAEALEIYYSKQPIDIPGRPWDWISPGMYSGRDFSGSGFWHLRKLNFMLCREGSDGWIDDFGSLSVGKVNTNFIREFIILLGWHCNMDRLHVLFYVLKYNKRSDRQSKCSPLPPVSQDDTFREHLDNFCDWIQKVSRDESVKKPRRIVVSTRGQPACPGEEDDSEYDDGVYSDRYECFPRYEERYRPSESGVYLDIWR